MAAKETTETKETKPKKAAKAKAPKETTADKIWDTIKGIDLKLFSLPNQILETKVKRMPITDDCVHLKMTIQAVLPALEEALKDVPAGKGKRWQVTQSTLYTVVELVDA